jgi:copper chaperone CopZ
VRRRVLALSWLLVAGFGALTACDRGVDRVRTTFTVNGMHCDACSTSIVSTLEKVEGVDEVTADHELGMAEAVYSPRDVGAEELKTEIEMLGYTVTGFETEVLES